MLFSWSSEGPVFVCFLFFSFFGTGGNWRYFWVPLNMHHERNLTGTLQNKSWFCILLADDVISWQSWESTKNFLMMYEAGERFGGREQRELQSCCVAWHGNWLGWNTTVNRLRKSLSMSVVEWVKGMFGVASFFFFFLPSKRAVQPSVHLLQVLGGAEVGETDVVR